MDETAAGQIHSPHYLKSLTELGDAKHLVASRDIYSTARVKLVANGTRFDSRLYDKLLNHRLLPSLDQCLSMEGGVTGSSLEDEAASLLNDPRLRCIRNGEDLLHFFSAIPLHPAIAFKLTVMRERHPELFRHSLFVAMVCCYIGERMGLRERQLERMATAGLLHDIGIMHVDPRLLERSHKMNDAERHHLYAHPLTAWMILNEYAEYSTDVLDAVLQHHERLDGSGYPRGLKEGDIGLPGQILAVSEIVAGRKNRNDAHDRLRLGTILKFNSRRYGQRLIGHLNVFYQEDADTLDCTEDDRKQMRTRLDQLNGILAGWQSCADHAEASICNFVQNRMDSLRMELRDTGLISGENNAIVAPAEEEPQTCAEMGILLGEAIWRVKSILSEVRRRWPEIDRETGLPKYRSVGKWMHEVEKILS
ncbi:MAG TPA: HD domain-containing phosphohydrolase [Burkholderiales bacterium]|nr:HD domain-containing phosphohydrolase [Burkholderiales bacterium]